MIITLYIFLGLCENILSIDNIEEQNQRLLYLCIGLLEQICNTANVSIMQTFVFSTRVCKVPFLQMSFYKVSLNKDGVLLVLFESKHQS